MPNALFDRVRYVFVSSFFFAVWLLLVCSGGTQEVRSNASRGVSGTTTAAVQQSCVSDMIPKIRTSYRTSINISTAATLVLRAQSGMWRALSIVGIMRAGDQWRHLLNPYSTAGPRNLYLYLSLFSSDFVPKLGLQSSISGLMKQKTARRRSCCCMGSPHIFARSTLIERLALRMHASVLPTTSDTHYCVFSQIHPSDVLRGPIPNS